MANPDPRRSTDSRASANARRSGNPAKRAAASQAGADSTRRDAVNERSRGLLVRLSRLPRLVIPGLMLVLMLTGLAAPLWAALPAFAVIAAFVGWLAYISWPVLDSRGRLLRGVMLGIVIGSAIARVQGWL